MSIDKTIKIQQLRFDMLLAIRHALECRRMAQHHTNKGLKRDWTMLQSMNRRKFREVRQYLRSIQ